jgi:hypothetical protein
MHITGRRSESAARRTFLRTAATAAGALIIPGSLSAAPGRRFELQAEGVVPLTFVLSPAPPPIPVEIVTLILDGTLEIRQRVIYPDRKRLASILVFVTSPTAPLGLTPPAESIVSIIHVEVDDVVLSRRSVSPGFLLPGRVVATPVPSPFGDIVGCATAVSAGYLASGDTTFTMLGGTVAGSHTTWSPVAFGRIGGKDVR